MFYKVLVKDAGLVLLLFLLVIFLLDPYSLALYVGYLIVLFLFLFRKREIIDILDSESFILLTFSLTYSAFDFLNGNDRGIQILIVQSIFPFFFYCLGKCLISKNMNQKHILFLTLFSAIIFSLSPIATILKDLINSGFSQVNRDFNSIWDGREILATGMAGYLIYNVTIPVFVVSKNNLLNIVEKTILLLVFFITLICSFRLGSRTIIVLSAFSLLFGAFYQLRVLELKDKFKFVVQIVSLIIILVYFVPFDLEADYFSTLGHRLREGTSSNASAGGRTELWSNSFDKILSNPLGWKSDKYGHNMWLDTAKVSGMIPLAFLLFYTIKSIVNAKKVFLTNNLDASLRLCFGLFTIISLIFFFGEPILEGNIFLFIFFCFQQGIIKRSMELQHYIA